MNEIKTWKVKKGGLTAVCQIVYDENPESPRVDRDNLWSFAFFHNRYALGDMEFETPEKFKEYVKEMGERLITIPIRMYDHSGLGFARGGTIKAESYPYNCPWDSGLIGYAYVTKEQVWDEFGKPSTRNRQKQILALLDSELEVYEAYLNGNVYGYIVKMLDKDGEQEEVEACFGFYADFEYCVEEANSMAEYLLSKAEE